MTVEQHTPVNSVTTAQPKPTTEFLQLQQQITKLTAQVAALTTCQVSSRTLPAIVENRPKRCFICNKVGHMQYNCPTCQDPRSCFTCGQQVHPSKATYPQGNGQVAAAWLDSVVALAREHTKIVVHPGRKTLLRKLSNEMRLIGLMASIIFFFVMV